jgi:hypothetical protein
MLCSWCALGLAGSVAATPVEREQPIDILERGLEILQVDHADDWFTVTYEFENLGDRRIGVGAVRCEANRDLDGELVSASDRITAADIPLGSQRGVVVLKLGTTAGPDIRCRVEVTHWMTEGRYVEAAGSPAGLESPPNSLAEVSPAAARDPDNRAGVVAVQSADAPLLPAVSAGTDPQPPSAVDR